MGDIRTVQNERKIYYSKKSAWEKMIPGLLFLGFGITLALHSMFSESHQENEDQTNALFGLFFFVFAPVILGSIIVLRNIMRLTAKDPQLIFDEKGIEVGVYKAWGKTDWKDIVGIKFAERTSLGSGKKEDCIILTLSEERTEKVFNSELQIKYGYYNVRKRELFDALSAHIESAKSSQPT